MIKLTDEEIRELTGHTTLYEPTDSQINYSLREVRKISQAQLKQVAQYLEDNGARFVKDEWEAIGHGGYYEIEWAKILELFKEAGLNG